ncbi:hypothetical protein V6Z11_A06G182700 [Gossypium hirsutum]
MVELALYLCLFMCLILTCYAQTCAKYAFSSNRVFKSCTDLPVLNSFLHYNYDVSGKLEIAYRHTGITSSRWIAWAINPTSKAMVGSQALVAYQLSDGSMRAYTSPITQYQTQLQEVWQEGAMSGNTPQMHATSGPNVQSMGTLNLLSGQAGTIGGRTSTQRKQNIHGVLNAVSWGILMPLGAIIARS